MCILRECVRVLALLHLCCFINLLLNHYIRHIRILFSLPPSLDPNPNISLSLSLTCCCCFCFVLLLKGTNRLVFFFVCFHFHLSLSFFVSNVFDWRAFRKIWKLSFFHAVIVASLHCHLQRMRSYLSLSHFIFSIDCFFLSTLCFALRGGKSGSCCLLSEIEVKLLFRLEKKVVFIFRSISNGRGMDLLLFRGYVRVCVCWCWCAKQVGGKKAVSSEISKWALGNNRNGTDGC